MGAVAVSLISVAVMMRTIQIPEEHYDLYRRDGIVTFGSGLVILLLGFSGLGTIPLLIVLILFLLTPIFYRHYGLDQADWRRGGGDGDYVGQPL